MLTALNTKLLIAILAAVTAIGSIVAYDHHKAAEAAEKAAAAAEVLQKQHQQEVDYENQIQAQIKKARKNNTNPANESSTWDNYIP